MFKFFVNTNIQNICECTHNVPTFCKAMQLFAMAVLQIRLYINDLVKFGFE